jgi:hypothetical protein
MPTPSSSSRVGLLVPLRATEPLLMNLPPSVRVAPLPTTMAPALTPMPVPSVAVKVPPVTSSVAPLDVAMLPTVGLSEAVLLTTPPLRMVACVVGPGLPLVQLLVVDQPPTLPAFHFSNELMPLPTANGKPVAKSATLPPASVIVVAF